MPKSFLLKLKLAAVPKPSTSTSIYRDLGIIMPCAWEFAGFYFTECSFKLRVLVAYDAICWATYSVWFCSTYTYVMSLLSAASTGSPGIPSGVFNSTNALQEFLQSKMRALGSQCHKLWAFEDNTVDGRFKARVVLLNPHNEARNIQLPWSEYYPRKKDAKLDASSRSLRWLHENSESLLFEGDYISFKVEAGGKRERPEDAVNYAGTANDMGAGPVKFNHHQISTHFLNRLANYQPQHVWYLLKQQRCGQPMVSQRLL